MEFGYIMGLWALLSLVPLIILYLRRPKPIDKVFPSLIFLVKERGDIRKYSFFRNLLRNLLFLLQLLILAALALSLAKPYIPTTGITLGQHNVIVIDASASSQTMDNGQTRFEKEVQEAAKYINGRTSIILAGSTPEVVLENGGEGASLDTLKTIKPKDTITNLESAMRVAESLVKRGKIVVISDFKTTEGQDPLIIKRILSSKGIPVDFVDIGNRADNIGFIDLSVNKYETKAYVKNYNEEDVSVKIQLIKNSVMDEVTKTIKANSVETVSFSTLPGASRLELDAKDDFELDNKVFISAPTKMKIKVLLVRNPKYDSETQSYLMNALESSPDIELSTAEPPIIPSVKGYDIIILGGVFSDMLLPSFFKDVSMAVDNGTSFVIAANENLGNIMFQGLLPVQVIGVKEEEARINVNIVNRFTNDIDFSLVKVSKYFQTKADNSTAAVASIKDSPVIAVREKGSGKVVYVGIMDKYSDFKLSPDYPIFWNLLLNFLTGSERVEDYNMKIEDRPQLDKRGYYKETNRNLAFNFLNEAESDISKEKSITEMEKDMSFTGVEEEARYSFEIPLIILATLLIFAELLYIKMRGDL